MSNSTTGKDQIALNLLEARFRPHKHGIGCLYHIPHLTNPPPPPHTHTHTDRHKSERTSRKDSAITGTGSVNIRYVNVFRFIIYRNNGKTRNIEGVSFVQLWGWRGHQTRCVPFISIFFDRLIVSLQTHETSCTETFIIFFSCLFCVQCFVYRRNFHEISGFSVRAEIGLVRLDPTLPPAIPAGDRTQGRVIVRLGPHSTD